MREKNVVTKIQSVINITRGYRHGFYSSGNNFDLTSGIIERTIMQSQRQQLNMRMQAADISTTPAALLHFMNTVGVTRQDERTGR
jgi:hypothetical protein